MIAIRFLQMCLSLDDLAAQMRHTTLKFSHTHYKTQNTYPHTHANRGQTHSQVHSGSDVHLACSHTQSEDHKN